MAGRLHRAPGDPAGSLTAEVKLNGRTLKALLDSGSSVSLVLASLLPPRVETKTYLSLTCVHGDTKDVPARRVSIATAVGSWPVEVGVVKDLPVPVLLGRDWPGFDQLLAAATQPASRTPPRRPQRAGRGARRQPVFLTSDSGRDGESPSLNNDVFFDVFQQVQGGGSFGRAQREDDRLKNCWTQESWKAGTSSRGPILSHASLWRTGCYTVSPNGGGRKNGCW